MNRWIGVGAIVLLSLSGCGGAEASHHVLAPDGPSMAKGGNGGRNDGDNLVVDIIAGDFAGDNLVRSTCSGDSQSSYNVVFGDADRGTNAGCLVITTSDGTKLIDDIFITVGVKSGASTSVAFWGRDAAGSGGILHESDPMPVNPPTPVGTDGFTIHVHATVAVWRLGGHNSSRKVAQVGTVALGDLLYRVP